MVEQNLRYTAHKCASEANAGTHCDYLSFQTWKRQECVTKWERQYVVLAEIKTEAARHFGFILWILCLKTLYLFFMLILPHILSLSLSLVAASISLLLFSPSFPVFDAHTLSHFIDSPLFSVLTLTPSGALARACSLSGEF